MLRPIIPAAAAPSDHPRRRRPVRSSPPHPPRPIIPAPAAAAPSDHPRATRRRSVWISQAMPKHSVHVSTTAAPDATLA